MREQEFLYNLRELKEISNIMDLIQDRHVENSDAKKSEAREKAAKQNNKDVEADEETKEKEIKKEVTRKTLMQGAIKGNDRIFR